MLTIVVAFVYQIPAKMTQDVEMKEQQEPAPTDSIASTSPSALQREYLLFMHIIFSDLFEFTLDLLKRGKGVMVIDFGGWF